MINTRIGVDRTGLGEVGGLAEIPEIAQTQPVFKSRPFLLPGEEEASLPEFDYPLDPVQESLKQILGARLSVDNPAWVGDPIPRMRALQKKMIEFSLTQETSERGVCMEAIRVVELAVRWRLRWQQMRRSDLEGHPTSVGTQDTQDTRGRDHEEQETA